VHGGGVEVLGLEVLSEESIVRALEVVRAYMPAMARELIKQDLSEKKNKKNDQTVDGKNFTPRYYALQLGIDLVDILGKKLSGLKVNPKAALVWDKLQAAGQVSKCPHISIIHQNSMPKEAKLWNMCAALHMLEEPPLFKVMLGKLVWNEQLLVIMVEQLEVVPEEDKNGKWRGKVPRLARELLDVLEEVGE
jgi:tRNA ligase